MSICVFVADLTVIPVTILEANRHAELVYGFTAAELVGNAVAQLVPEESRESVHDILRRVQRGETVTARTINRRRDGTTFPVRVVARLDPSNRGRMIATVEDITAEIEAERRRAAPARADIGMLEELRAALAAAIADMRRAIVALRPVDLDALGVLPALKQLVADFGYHNQLAVRFDVSGPRECLPKFYELPLFRTVQQGLHNIARHAGVSLVQVWVAVDPAGGVVLSLHDNGRGFDLTRAGAADHSRQSGLRQMRQRILDLGATLEIRSAIGQGTELLITLPPVAKAARKADHATG